ncbi:hypothetical protein D3C81_2174070 [compost metagenome]
MSALDGIEEEVQEIFCGSLFVDEARSNAICLALRERIERLQEIIHTREPQAWLDDHSTDVKENIAYSGFLEAEEDWE